MNGFSPVDSWVIARLLADQPVNGELDLMSQPNRPLAMLLATMKGGERRCAWQGATQSARPPGDPEGRG